MKLTKLTLLAFTLIFMMTPQNIFSKTPIDIKSTTSKSTPTTYNQLDIALAEIIQLYPNNRDEFELEIKKLFANFCHQSNQITDEERLQHMRFFLMYVVTSCKYGDTATKLQKLNPEAKRELWVWFYCSFSHTLLDFFDQQLELLYAQLKN